MQDERAALLPSAEGDNGTVPLYLDNGTTVDYKLLSISFRLDPSGSGVAVVAHNTPKNLHALTQNQQMEYYIVLEHARRCDDVKCLVWTATGNRSFGSGAALTGGLDIQLDAAVKAQYHARGMAPDFDSKPPDIALKRATLTFWDFPKPIVGAINGLAVGGHANVALANYFDIVLASSKARFKYPFAKLGLTPELGSSSLIPFVIGMARSKQLMMCGDWFYPEQAKEWGLVNEIYEPEELFGAAMKLARKLAKTNTSALRLGKRLLNHHLRINLPAVMDEENKTIIESIKAMGAGGVFGGKQPAKKGKSKL